MARLWACLVVTVACATPQISEVPLANSGTSPFTTGPRPAPSRVGDSPNIILGARNYACVRSARRTEATALLVSVEGSDVYARALTRCLLAADGGVAVVDAGTLTAHIVAIATAKRCSFMLVMTQGNRRITNSQESANVTTDAWDCIDAVASVAIERVMQQLPPGLPLSPWP